LKDLLSNPKSANYGARSSNYLSTQLFHYAILDTFRSTQQKSPDLKVALEKVQMKKNA